MKRLLYIANIRLPTERAHGLQIMKTCEALAVEGVEVELVIPDRVNHIKEDPFIFYGIAKKFAITRLPVWDLITNNYFKAVGFWVESFTFYRSVKKYIALHPAAAYYTRDALLASWFGKKIPRLYYEAHTLPDKLTMSRLAFLKNVEGIIVISEGIRRALLELGFAKEKIVVVPDAVDPEAFLITEDKMMCRKKLNLPANEKIVLYTGHLYEWKGAHLIAEVATSLPQYTFYFVGGTTSDLKKFADCFKALNIRLIGWRPHSEIPFWNKAADVVVLPTSGKTKIGREYTSPMKLFEYALSGTPIVASRLPSIEATLSKDEVFYFEPDTTTSLSRAILKSFEDNTIQKNNQARLKARIAKECSWKERARKIYSIIF